MNFRSLRENSNLENLMNIHTSEQLLNDKDQFYARTSRQILQDLKDKGVIDITVYGLIPLKKLLEIKYDLDSDAKSTDYKFKMKIKSAMPSLQELDASIRNLTKAERLVWEKQDWACMMILLDIQESLLNDLGAQKHNLIAKKLLPLKLHLVKRMTE